MRGPLAIAVTLACVTACSGSEELPRVDHLILVSIDSLRADHVGAYGYPRPTTPVIDGLAASGTAFSRAYSTTSWTLPAHAALFSGLDDFAHGVETPRQRLAPEVETLAEALARAGMRTTGFYSGPYLHAAFGLDQGFDEYVNCTSYTPAEGSAKGARNTLPSALRDVTNPILLERVRGWLETASADERHFVFIHMWDVHFDYIAPQRFVELFDPDYAGALSMDGFIANPAIRAGMAARELQHVVAQYDAEVRYTDETLGAILALFDAAGLLARSAVVVLADHGDEFFEHGQKGHKKTLFEEVLRIPLVVNVSGWEPERRLVDEVVSLVDVAPTVCDLLDAPCPEGASGRSLVPLMAEARGAGAEAGDGEAFAELYDSPSGPQVALVDGQGKAIRWLDRGVTQFFDTEALGDEQRGVVAALADPAALSAAAPGTARRLHARLAAAPQRSAPSPQAQAQPQLDAATRSQLQSLGYAE